MFSRASAPLRWVLPIADCTRVFGKKLLWVLPKMRVKKTRRAEIEKPDKTFLIFFENFICIIKR
jgi:hypothetical protein